MEWSVLSESMDFFYIKQTRMDKVNDIILTNDIDFPILKHR